MTWRAEGMAIFDGRDCIGIFDTDTGSVAECEKRAKLAAAAPAMLASLKCIAQREGDSITGKLARATVAQAEG